MAAAARTRFLLMIVLPLIAIAIATTLYYRGGQVVSTENAYIKSDIIAISADVDGRALLVGVTNNQRVNEGDVLFRLDSEPLELEATEARSRMAVVRSDVETMRTEFREAEISVAEAINRVQYLTRQLQRQKTMKKRGIGSAQTLDEAQFNLQAALQRVDVLNERRNRTLVSFAGDQSLPVEKHPEFVSAQVKLDQALSQLAKTTVRAPANGIVSNVSLQAGEYVEAGKAVFSLIAVDRVWVEANLKETQLTNITEGQPATFEVDAYPGVEWQANVDTIAPATGAQFSLLPPQNASGNWVKVVQRVPVNLTVEQTDGPHILRAGMTVSVKIDTGRRRQLPGFLQALLNPFVAGDASGGIVPEAHAKGT